MTVRTARDTPLPQNVASIPPTTRINVQLFEEIAADLKIRIVSIMNGHIIQMEKGTIRKQVMNYAFDLNGAGAARTCRDKTATSATLQQSKVPHVEHILPSACDPNELAKQYNYNLVCKPKEGTWGIDVVRVRKPEDLQKAISKIFNPCFSPYYEIEHEYRVVMLNHVPQTVFEKVKPQIVGDGKSTVAQLIANYFSNTPPAFLQKMEEFKPASLPLGKILNPEEIMDLQWKHNLFTARVLDTNEQGPLLRNIHELAIAATKSLGIIFCCVDIIAIKGGDLRVLEVNSSVWLEESEIGYESVKKIYTAAISLMLDLPEKS